MTDTKIKLDESQRYRANELFEEMCSDDGAEKFTYELIHLRDALAKATTERDELRDKLTDAEQVDTVTLEHNAVQCLTELAAMTKQRDEWKERYEYLDRMIATGEPVTATQPLNTRLLYALRDLVSLVEHHLAPLAPNRLHDAISSIKEAEAQESKP